MFTQTYLQYTHSDKIILDDCLQIRFVDKLPYHLNVNQGNGQVCVGFLSEANWSTTCTLEQIVNAVFSILSRPETSNAMDHELLNKFHHFSYEYEQNARRSARATVTSK